MSEAVEAFEIEYDIPSNVFSFWPVVFTLFVPAALGYGAHRLFPGTHLYAPVAALAFAGGVVLLARSFRSTRGRTRFMTSPEGLVIEERPGKTRRVSFADIARIQPRKREDPYERDLDEAFLVIDLHQGRPLRVPEHAAYCMPLELAEEAARKALASLRRHKEK